ncbi:MAG: glycosyltransferase [Clostridia bacterium]|nr:glycosyltransferase [Clostridia bacterium]
MRIIQFCDTFLPIMDGVGNVVYQYARNMGLKGHESYVVAPQANTGYRGNFPFEIVDYIGVPLLKLKSYKVGTPLLDVHCQNRLNQIHADIVHAHSPFVAGHAGLSCAHRQGCPIVGTFHSKYYDDFLQITGINALAALGTKYVVNFYEKCDEVWAVNESSAQTLRDYGYGGDIRVVCNGTDLAEADEQAIRAVSEQYAPDGAPLLLFVGQMNWKKNLRCVLEACAKLRRPFRLVLAGQGPHEKDIAKLAKDLGIDDRVRMTGHMTDRDLLNALYKRSSLFLFPSVYDNSPLVVREAAAMGTPAVVVRRSSASEGMRDGFNGFLCDNDPADLARVIERALSDPEALEEIGENARKTIPIPWSVLVDEVLEHYGQIIHQNRK